MEEEKDMYTELQDIRESLEAVLERVDDLIDDILDGETLDTVEAPPRRRDTFSEEKEDFIAP
jgi:hypothetical protein